MLGAIVLILFIIAYLIWCFINQKIDPLIVTAWLTNFMLLISVYNKMNVAQKKIISENFIPELNKVTSTIENVVEGR